MSEVADDQKMDTLLMLFTQVEAEAIKQGNVEMQGMVYGNTIISHINRKEYDEIIQKAPGYLDFYIRHELWKFYYQINMQLITAYNLKGDYKQAAEAAELMFDRARKREDKAGMALALYATGITYNVQQQRWQRGRRMFQSPRVILALDGVGLAAAHGEDVHALIAALHRHLDMPKAVVPEHLRHVFLKFKARQPQAALRAVAPARTAAARACPAATRAAKAGA